MLAFYTDQNLTRLVSGVSPKVFCIPMEGGLRTTRLYLADTYFCKTTVDSESGATSLTVDQTVEFLEGGGKASIGNLQISYTGKTETSLTGVSGLTSAFASGTQVKPLLKYVASGNVRINVVGVDAIGLDAEVSIALKRSDQSTYGFRGTPAIYGETEIASTDVIAFDAQVTLSGGPNKVYSDIQFLAAGFVVRGIDDSTPAQEGEQLYSAICTVNVDRHNQGLIFSQRVFPSNRKLDASLPGFITGQYRWRDAGSINAQAIKPTDWNVDISTIPDSQFVSGIADGDDLEPLVVEEFQNSLYLRIRDGFYFNRRVRSYLPAGALLEILPSSPEALEHTLQQSPSAQTPIFVGTWAVNQNGSFVKATEYRYAGHTYDADNPAKQFTVNRKTGELKLYGSMPQHLILLGTVSGDPIDYFDVPVYPVMGVSQVYIDRGPIVSHLGAPTFTFDREAGTISVPSIDGSQIGQPVFAVCDPGVAVLYGQDGPWIANASYKKDTCITFNGFIFRAQNDGLSGQDRPPFNLSVDSTTQDSEVEWVCEGPVKTVRATADLNPAFAGISQGFVYLAETFKGAYSIQLACDKPRIAIPPSQIGVPGLIAFGPVYYDGDYSLLIATVFDSNKNPISNVELEVIPGDDFDGLVNYVDPRVTPVRVRTGGDGIANLIYTPRSGFGYYIPGGRAGLPVSNISTKHITGDTITLPLDIPLTQVWNAVEGWLTTLYQVKDDNPYFGISDADTSIGQVEFTETGTPGTTSYRTNGRRAPILGSDGKALEPIEARDSLGNLTTDSGFTGTVRSLTFGQTIPVDDYTAAYFISYIERVTLRVQARATNIKSNTILLQMAPPALIADETPYLVLDNETSGTLNVQRLSYVGAVVYFPGTALI